MIPQGVLEAIPLVEDEVGEEGARARARYELGFLLCFVANITLLEMGSEELGLNC